MGRQQGLLLLFLFHKLQFYFLGLFSPYLFFEFALLLIFVALHEMGWRRYWIGYGFYGNVLIDHAVCLQDPVVVFWVRCALEMIEEGVEGVEAVILLGKKPTMFSLMGKGLTTVGWPRWHQQSLNYLQKKNLKKIQQKWPISSYGNIWRTGGVAMFLGILKKVSGVSTFGAYIILKDPGRWVLSKIPLCQLAIMATPSNFASIWNWQLL